MTTPRPVAPAPNVDAIPAEMKARPQWVCWRYELDDKGKWSKVPYAARGYKASTTRPTSWLPFDTALERYQADKFFDGVGYVFSADDPFVGGDIDHDLNTDQLPDTYAEYSVSGDGIHFIAIASGKYGRHSGNRELYSQARFFTVTGDVLPGHEQIRECQAQVEAFAASLGTPTRTASGNTANGSRADLVSAIPESEWEAARQLARSHGDRLVERAKRAAGTGTQLDLILREQYAAFHARWPFVGLYRKDSTLDTSQKRAVAAWGIRGRGFTFPEYVVIMSRLYAREAHEKWGAKELWRQELAALWNDAPAPARQWAPAAHKPKGKEHGVARGRAGSHADLVEQVYATMRDLAAGNQAIVTAKQIGDVIYCARETVWRIIKDLRDAKRIETRRLPRHAGLCITFLDVIYSAPVETICAAETPQNDDRPVVHEETREISTHPPVFLPDRAIDHSSQSLDAAIKEAFELLPHDRPNERTGELTRWPITDKRIMAYLAEQYPGRWSQKAAAHRIAQVRKMRRNARFAEIRDMPSPALDKAIAGAERTIVKFEKLAEAATCDKIRADWRKRANSRRGNLAMLAAERAARDEREARRLEQFGYALVEQQAMLEQVERQRDPLAWRPGRAVKVEPETPATVYHPSYVSEMIERLKAARVQPVRS